MRLDEITLAWDAFYADVEAVEGEVTPELEARHQCLELDTREKVDGYIIRIRAFEEEEESLKRFQAQIGAKRAAITKQVEWLKARVRAHMEARVIKALPGKDLTGFKLQNAGGVQGLEILLEDAREWPVEYQVKTITLDTEKVRKSLDPNGALHLYYGGDPEDPANGDFLAARLKPRGTVLRHYV